MFWQSIERDFSENIIGAFITGGQQMDNQLEYLNGDLRNAETALRNNDMKMNSVCV